MTTRYGVIGAGLAGAATAYHLSYQAGAEVTLLEQETTPGVHASGQNAAMIRQVVPDPQIGELARAGAAFLHGQAQEAGIQLDRHGSLLLGRGPQAESLRQDAAEAQAAGLDVQLLEPQDVVARVPVAEGNPFEVAVCCPNNGVVDVAGLLHHYLAQAGRRGATLLTDQPVQAIAQVKGGWRLTLPARTMEVDVVVNASGAWAERIGRMAGAATLDLTPYRRHLIYTGPLAWASPKWSFVWDVSHGLYFRPESAGLLLSACDEAAWEPGTPPMDPTVLDMLSEKLSDHLPRLADLPVNRVWAGLRTFSRDRRFVIGWDSQRDGLFWVAALGGHGVTTSYGVGQLAARLLGEGQGARHPAFDPNRSALVPATS